MSQAIHSLTLDGISYSINQFSPQVQQLTNFYNALFEDQTAETHKLMKTQAAIAQVHSQITELVKFELARLTETKTTNPEQETTSSKVD